MESAPPCCPSLAAAAAATGGTPSIHATGTRNAGDGTAGIVPDFSAGSPGSGVSTARGDTAGEEISDVERWRVQRGARGEDAFA